MLEIQMLLQGEGSRGCREPEVDLGNSQARCWPVRVAGGARAAGCVW